MMVKQIVGLPYSQSNQNLKIPKFKDLKNIYDKVGL